jgi:hypothetical protein
MERESPPANLDIIGIRQFFNTPGNEITPGSDIIGKDFEYGHDSVLLAKTDIRELLKNCGNEEPCVNSHQKRLFLPGTSRTCFRRHIHGPIKYIQAPMGHGGIKGTLDICRRFL